MEDEGRSEADEQSTDASEVDGAHGEGSDQVTATAEPEQDPDQNEGNQDNTTTELDSSEQENGNDGGVDSPDDQDDDIDTDAEESSKNTDSQVAEQPIINRREKPDIIQLKVGSNLRMLLGYEKMKDLGAGKQVKSRLITTQVEIIVVDSGVSMMLWAGVITALAMLEIV